MGRQLHHLTSGLPGVTRTDTGPTVYQVSRRSFLFFRNPRPDAVDPQTGERWTDVIVFWVESEMEKRPSWPDGSLPFFITPHFNGHPGPDAGIPGVRAERG